MHVNLVILQEIRGQSRVKAIFPPLIKSLVEVWGVEPQTFSLRTRRSTN